MTSRRLGSSAAIAFVAALLVLVALGLQQGAHNASLPLSNASIIRRQAAAKHLDPALIAAVIYAESKFEPRPSPAGAQGSGRRCGGRP